MDRYGEGAAATLTLPLTIQNPNSATYTIADEEGVEILASTSLSISNTDTQASVTVAGTTNVLSSGKIRSLFVVTVTVLDSSGNKEVVKARYVVEKNSEMEVPASSFQTLNVAMLTVLDVPNVDAFEAADEDTQRKALAEAHWRLDQMYYDTLRGNHSYVTRQDRITDDMFDTDIRRVSEMTTSEFNGVDARFKSALLKAQIVEADDILGGNPIEKQRSDGLMSESVGESSQMYRPGKPVELPVGRRAFAYVSDWVIQQTAIGRG